MINVIIFIVFALVIVSWVWRKAEQFDNWFKNKVTTFLQKDTERYLNKKKAK